MTTRRLLLMRHAKSSWANPGMPDHDRPLNSRGQRDAPRMAQWLVDNLFQPESIAASTAARVKQTLNLMLPELTGLPSMSFFDDLYLASPATLIEFAHQFDPNQSTAMIIAHNPGLEELAASFHTSEFLPMPTAAIAVIEGEGDSWEEALVMGSAKLIQIARPKEI